MKVVTRVKAMLAAAVAAAGIVAFAKPSVEVSNLEFANPSSGKADLTCTITGIEDNACYDLSLKISAKGSAPAFLAIWNVQNGTISTNVNYQALLGKCYPNVSVFAKLVKSHPAVQLWENGPFWATCNVGAEEPEEYGYYFGWGDTVGYVHSGTSWETVDGSEKGYSFANVSTYNKGLQALRDEGYVDETGKLLPDHDASQAYWGAQWRMPTGEELHSLSNCSWEALYDASRTVKGFRITGVGDYAGNAIFLPAAGFGSATKYVKTDGSPSSAVGDYWASTVTKGKESTHGDRIYFIKGSKLFDGFDRRRGFPVRAVRNTPR